MVQSFSQGSLNKSCRIILTVAHKSESNPDGGGRSDIIFSAANNKADGGREKTKVKSPKNVSLH